MINKKFKLIVCLLSVIMILNTPIINAYAVESKVTREDVKKTAQKTIDYYYDNFKEKDFRGVLDWPALGLYGFGEDVSSSKWTTEDGKNGAYWRETEVQNNQRLSTVKNTDFQRTIIGVCAAGKNPRDFGGKNLVEIVKNTMLPNGHFADSVEDRKTGEPIGNDLINAHCFGVIALHCAGEPIPNRDKCIEWLVNNQHKDGGFTWDVKYFDDPEDYDLVESDVDMTAAGLMALAILGLDENHPAVEKALQFLKDNQLEDGGFHSWGTENPESCSWSIKAITLLGQDPMGEEWTKPCGGNPVSSIMKFQLENGGFAHVLNDDDMLPIYDNGMSTEQSLYGLACAYNNKCVYDMLYEEYRPQAEKNLFSDYKQDQFGFKETMDLVYEYIINGYSDGTFKPNNSITRAEFAKLLVRGLKLESELENYDTSNTFEDIPNYYWAKKYIGVCSSKGFVNGTSENTYSPNDNITGEQLMVMLVRAANMEKEALKLNNKDKSWSYGYLQIAKEKGLVYDGFEASSSATRAQCAWSLHKLLNKK